MSLTLRAAAAAIALGLCGAGQAATLIDFEDFGNVGVSGPAVTNQYAGVVFSSSAGSQNIISTQPGIGFGNNFLCTGSPFIDCVHDTVMTFTTPVNGLQFWAVGSNNTGITAQVDIFVNGSFANTQGIFTNGIFNSPDLVDLSGYSNVTSVRIHDITDGGGLGWDNISFTAAVPEPETYALMLAGLAAVGWAARRRQRA